MKFYKVIGWLCISDIEGGTNRTFRRGLVYYFEDDYPPRGLERNFLRTTQLLEIQED